jgi:hypothetical protein
MGPRHQGLIFRPRGEMIKAANLAWGVAVRSARS